MAKERRAIFEFLAFLCHNRPVEKFDVVIIGGGPGGAKAARILGEAGKKVALIEQHLVGGECLHVGCIPSKVFLYSAELYEKAQRSSLFGVEVSDVKVDFAKLQERRKKVVEMLHRGLSTTLQKAGVTILHGRGEYIDSHTVQFVSAESGAAENIATDFIILAMGSAPAMIPGATLSSRILTNRTLFDLSELPQSILIVGGGSIGCEFASFFGAVGTKVTLIERAERILMLEDKDIASDFAKILARRNVDILTGTSLQSLTDDGSHVKAVDEKGVEYVAPYALIAVGRKKQMLSTMPDFGSVNEYMQTAVAENVYAIGDVAGKWLLAYTADFEGEIAARHILGEKNVMNLGAVPSTIFTSPEIASVGAKEEDVPSAISGRANFSANAKALIEGDRDGFVKVVFDGGTRKLVGVHILGKHATLLIDKASLAVQEGMTPELFLRSVHGHPVLSEVLKEAVEDALKKMR